LEAEGLAKKSAVPICKIENTNHQSYLGISYAGKGWA